MTIKTLCYKNVKFPRKRSDILSLKIDKTRQRERDYKFTGQTKKTGHHSTNDALFRNIFLP